MNCKLALYVSCRLEKLWLPQLYMHLTLRDYQIRMSIIQFSLTKASVKTSKDTLRKIMKSRNRILFPFGCMAVWLAGCYCNLWDNRQLHCRMYNMACSATTSVPFYQVIYYVSLYIDIQSHEHEYHRVSFFGKERK